MSPGKIILAVVVRGVSLLVRYCVGRKHPCGRIGCPQWTATERDHCRELSHLTIARCPDYRAWQAQESK